MEPNSFVDPHLLPSDLIVLDRLLQDIDAEKHGTSSANSEVGECEGHETTLGPRSLLDSGYDSVGDVSLVPRKPAIGKQCSGYESDGQALDELQGLTNPQDDRFTPTVFVTWDLPALTWHPWLKEHVLLPYVRWAQTVVRVPTDVVMLTHLLMYGMTSVPSACILYTRFSYVHGVLHWLVQSWYTGSYTLMMHQHIHQGGILRKEYAWLDRAFPYITDPLHGHTWNSYYYHHVKHHHVEGNGPDDLSSTIRLQRDSIRDFLFYVGRFMLLVWVELPMYFIRRGQYKNALKGGVSEFGSYVCLTVMATQINFRATLFVFLLPFCVIRAGLMIGNWGQHALVDETDPDSDFRSSITLIDVPSNRYSFNDGYHTSHHLNPHRHWREHPAAFLRQKERYARENALVFRNIDYIMLTMRLLRKDYDYLARCLVPIGDQIKMSQQEIATMLRKKTKKMSEEDIQQKFGKQHRQ